MKPGYHVNVGFDDPGPDEPARCTNAPVPPKASIVSARGTNDPTAPLISYWLGRLRRWVVGR